LSADGANTQGRFATCENVKEGTVSEQSWLLALDVDGTLLGFDESLSAAVRDAVQDVLAAGHHIVLASGRSLVAMRPVAQRLGICDGWMVCSNGAVTVRSDVPTPQSGLDAPQHGSRVPQSGLGVSQWVIEQAHTFDPEQVLRTLVTHFPTALFAAEEVGIGFRVTAPFPEGELGGEHFIVGIQDLWRTPVTRIIVRAHDVGFNEFHATVARIGLKDVAYAIGWTSWLDVAPRGVNKATALERVRVALGVPPQRTLAMGDGHNDVEMLHWAARGVAMGDAPSFVQAAANEVTGLFAHNGAATALRSLL
jgi:hydroxymethylpyrimidine pyrophosphatase-like HAD family hydrolase